MPVLPPTQLNRIRVRFLEQVLTEATAVYWEHRAAEFDQAQHVTGPVERCRTWRQGDYAGKASQEDRAARDARCRDTAQACRNHAQLIRNAGPLPGVAVEALQILSEGLAR